MHADCKAYIAACLETAMVAQVLTSKSKFVKKELRLPFHGKILDHLGFQVYQNPVASLAELVANAWDADATRVDISLPDALGGDSAIVVEDNGHGMTFDECQAEYMNVGYDRRAGGKGPRTRSGRLAMGRKGIGKFAGFGIAKRIRVETTSRSTGEETSFEMDIDELRSTEYLAEGGIIHAATRPPGSGGQGRHGTRITLSGLIMVRNISHSSFPRSMSSRFLVHRTAADFEIAVNGAAIPTSLDFGGTEFVFPRDYPPDKRPEGLRTDGEWAVESLGDGREVRWTVGFAKNPIKDSSLQGIGVFANGKLAQRPFFFNLAGTIPGQHGQSYMFGQVVADYVDQMGMDVISAERQRINWDTVETQSLLEWGQRRTGEVLRLWGELRAKKKVDEIEDKMSRFGSRLARLERHEQSTVKKVLGKLASIPSIRDDKFEDLASAILTSWVGGRLRDLWHDIAERDNLSESDLLDILAEANVVTALNVAEAVRTKIAALEQLEDRIKRQALERDVRDHVAKNPWMISPEWEYYRKEDRVSHIAAESAREVGLTGEEYRGRVDLLLSSGERLLVLEFMRPGLTVNSDHLIRCVNYVVYIRAAIKGITGMPFTRVSGLIVADKIVSTPHMSELSWAYSKSDINLIDWQSMIGDARARHEEFLRILGSRAPDDERLQGVASAVAASKKDPGD